MGQDAYSLARVLGDQPVPGPLTRSQCSPMSDVTLYAAPGQFAEPA